VKKPNISTDSDTSIETASTSVANNPDIFFAVWQSGSTTDSWCRVDCRKSISPAQICFRSAVWICVMWCTPIQPCHMQEL